jgi:hypothetical protein
MTASLMTLIQFEITDQQAKVTSLTKNTLHIVEFLVVALAVRLSMVFKIGPSFSQAGKRQHG